MGVVSVAKSLEEKRAYAREYMREYRVRHPERVAAARKATWAKHGQKYNFRRKWGITLEERDALITAQSGRCAICRQAFENSKDTHIDHDHDTDVIRGLLCSRCNLGLGMFKDSPESLRAAAAYLEIH